MPDDNPHTAPESANDPATAPPRAFATTTGFVLQIVGMVYFATGAIYWFASGRLQEVTPVRVDTLADYFNPTNAAPTITTLNVLATVAGGLALVAFGIGLQGERRFSGLGAMLAAASLTAISLSSTILYVALAGAWFRGALALLYTGVNFVLFLLAGQSAAILRRHPPPADLNNVDDAWVEEYHRSRRRY